MPQDILPTVEHASALLRVQLIDEVCGVVLVAVLVPGTQHGQEVLRSRFGKKKLAGMLNV